MTVEELPMGMRVKVAHLRRPEPSQVSGLTTTRRWRELGIAPASKGGVTIAGIYMGGQCLVVAEARCSDHDNYCKAIGRNIAVGRALKTLESM